MKKEGENPILEKNSKFSGDILIFFLSLFAIIFYVLLKTKSLGFLDSTSETFSKYIGFFEKALLVLIIFLVTSLFVAITKKIIKNYLFKLGRSKENIKLFLIIYGYIIWIIAIFFVFALFIKQGASFITSVGLIGFGLTLALQKPILNFVGWVTIIFGKVYQIGDIILINGVFGEVYDIRVMYTHVSELDNEGDATGKSIAVPNEFVFTNSIKNFTKGTRFIWDSILLHITYKSNWKKAVKIAEKTVQGYYDKCLKKEVQKELKSPFGEYEKAIIRFGAYEKGYYIKAMYLVDFHKSNNIKRELTELLLEKLKSKDISFGKTENV